MFMFLQIVTRMNGFDRPVVSWYKPKQDEHPTMAVKFTCNGKNPYFANFLLP